jgi:hypothetical protein
VTTQSPEWLTIREAALVLGVSDLTVRRRIKCGILQSRLEHGKYAVLLENADAGHRRPQSVAATNQTTQPHVSSQSTQLDQPIGIDYAESETSPVGAVPPWPPSQSARKVPIGAVPPWSPSRHSPGASFFDVARFVEEHVHLAEAAGRAEALERRVTDLEQQSLVDRDTIIVLSNRNGWLESKLEERESHLRLLSDLRAAQPWWKRLFRSARSEAV